MNNASVAYHLFVYREQLRRRKISTFRLHTVKHHLTNGLVAYTWQNITNYNKDELGIFMDTILYNEQLKYKIDQAASRKQARRQVTYL